MILKNYDPEILQDEPFKYDMLKRKSLANNLIILIKSIEQPFVLSINGDWGTGKTIFVKMFKALLHNEGMNTIYFNAWKHDFYSDPLVCFINEIENSINEHFSGREKGSLKSRLTTIKKYSTKIIRSSIPIALKLATHGIFDLDNITEENIGEFVESFTKNEIQEYEKKRKNLNKFRIKLSELALKMSVPEDFKPTHLIVFVDELDRCRPSFALDLLEKIKHLFSVEGVFFILSISKKQLINSISTVYGGETKDASGYLRRFIDYEFSLPEPSHPTYCTYLFERLKLTNVPISQNDQYEQDCKNDLIKIFSTLSNIFKFSLRVQEQCFTLFSIALRTNIQENIIQPILLAFLIALKAHDSDLYYKYCDNDVNGEELLNLFNKSQMGQYFLGSRTGFLLELLIRCGHFKDQDEYSDLQAQYEKNLKDNEEKLQYMRYQIKDFAKYLNFGIVPKLFNIIEMSTEITDFFDGTESS